MSCLLFEVGERMKDFVLKLDLSLGILVLYNQLCKIIGKIFTMKEWKLQECTLMLLLNLCVCVLGGGGG